MGECSRDLAGRAGRRACGAGVGLRLGRESWAATADEIPDDLDARARALGMPLDNGMYFTLALGNLLMYAALAVASLRHGVFPRQLGWVTAALAVASVTPGLLRRARGGLGRVPLLGWLIAREPSVDLVPAGA